jgi:hypothetical protein
LVFDREEKREMRSPRTSSARYPKYSFGSGVPGEDAAVWIQEQNGVVLQAIDEHAVTVLAGFQGCLNAAADHHSASKRKVDNREKGQEEDQKGGEHEMRAPIGGNVQNVEGQHRRRGHRKELAKDHWPEPTTP